jgi:SAM-dependent methyltransferase
VVDQRPVPVLPLRAWNAWRGRGTRYAWHKLLRRSLRRWPGWKRRFLYANPRQYWTLRGGDDYFREQEGQSGRTSRSQWLAERIAAFRPTSILEIGCGYGKQLRAIRQHLAVPMVGVDFSPTQLAKGRDFLREMDDVALVLGTGDGLPFGDRSFDLVLTSAVILHNPPPVAERMRQEVLRVARRFAAHNEDTDISYNRYGYDTGAWYRERAFPLAECGPIPVDPEPERTQFCVAELWHR